MLISQTKFARRTAHHLVTALSTRPTLYFLTRRLTGRMDELCIRRDTELVIEGYPRSANSTTAQGFLERQDRLVKVAHHKHHAAQLIRATKWGIPAVMLIRRPRDAIISFFALMEEGRRRTGRIGRGSALSFDDATLSWLAFYRSVFPYRDAVLVAPFDFVTRDLTGIIEKINQRFGTDFQSKPVDASFHHRLGWHARPSQLRENLKGQVEDAFLEVVKASPRISQLLYDCDTLYEKYLSRS